MPELENRDELRDILIEETTNYNSDALVRFGMVSKPSLTFTDEFASDDNINYTGGVMMSSNLAAHIFYSMLISLIVPIGLDGHYNNTIIVAIYLASSTVLTIIMRKIRFLNPVIKIDRNAITVGQQQIKWRQMKYSALLHYVTAGAGKGGGTYDYLVLVDSDNQIHKFNLHYILPEKIAPIIEYYKAEYNKAN